ncbi:hypothetical protein BLNAU_21015 [Blattamonas nauphoetae]|uniref:Uncharacterized protein n=1 Tax=Blattamonas nauphoetae TaxID=2049346 RepID=A0ABQ9X0A8_9EUKA|nr:hypothetical protein BLNAU_21015 [Blattamonas nauphoetae]
MSLEQNMSNREHSVSMMIVLRQMRMEEWEDTLEGGLLTDRKGDWGGGVMSNWMVLRNLAGLNDGQFGWMTTVASHVPAWSTFTCIASHVSSVTTRLCAQMKQPAGHDPSRTGIERNKTQRTYSFMSRLSEGGISQSRTCC